MNILYSIWQSFDVIFGGYPALLIIFGSFFLFKGFLLSYLVKINGIQRSSKVPSVYLIMVLIGSMLTDLAWILKAIKELAIININPVIYVPLVRLAWGGVIVEYQALALLTEYLTEGKVELSLRQKFFIALSLSSLSFFIAFAISGLSSSWIARQEHWVNTIIQWTASYLLLFLMFPVIIFALWRNKTYSLPRLVKKQISLFLFSIIIPFWFLDLLQIFPFNQSLNWVSNSAALANVANTFLLAAAVFSARRMMGLRFLNLKKHVEGVPSFDFVPKFKHVLERLSGVASEQEMTRAVQDFFKVGFNIEPHKILFKLRTQEKDVRARLGLPVAPEQKISQGPKLFHSANDRIVDIVETFIEGAPQGVYDFVAEHKVLIHDEIEFSNFYETSFEGEATEQFLEEMTADVFMPVFHGSRVVAYAIIDKNSRSGWTFYTDVERDQMLVFANYLSNVINLMQHKNLEVLLQREQELSRELHIKTQEVRQYKESLLSFVRPDKRQKLIGIIFYKNRRFTFGNMLAAELIKGVNLNAQDGMPLIRSLRTLVGQVESTESRHSSLFSDDDGSTFVFDGFPITDGSIAILIYHPEPSDIIRVHSAHLDESTDWDYLLYLETTRYGRAVNNFLPGVGEQLLSAKIKLLKVALSKSPIMLDNIAEEDLRSVVELLHGVNARATLHTINLSRPVQGTDIAIKLFGAMRMFRMQGASLLEMLDGSGTLFIKNVQFLPLEAQEHLAEFIRLGAYRPMRGDQYIAADVRIICSVSRCIDVLVHEGSLSRSLVNELSRTSLVLPQLSSISKKELHTLAEGFTRQSVIQGQFMHMLHLSQRDKERIVQRPPESIAQLKQRVGHVIEQKLKKNTVMRDLVVTDVASSSVNADLTEIARMGRRALQSRTTMTILWRAFGNQNQIAAFLGVNRSSVNRRCKQFEFGE